MGFLLFGLLTMDIFIICVAALFASLLTFFSGFGLGTLLMPVFALFFPIEVAIALTGIVHLLNNLFKMVLIGKNVVWRIVSKFGIPAIIGAVIGAWLLMFFSGSSELATYNIGNFEATITPVKLVVAILMFAFAFLDLMPFYQKLQFSEDKLIIGGAISGFFGGLSGHQGALRSAFLIRCGLSKESFIATGVMIASIVDVSRLSVYMGKYPLSTLNENITVLVFAVLSAFLGAFFGKRLLKKITVDVVHIAVSIMIMLLAIVIGLGII